MMKAAFWLLGLCHAFPVVAAEAIDQNLLKAFEARNYQEAGGKSLPYRFFKPHDYDPDQKYPLVLILHGAVGCGSDNQKQFAGGNRVPPAFFSAAENQARHPCFILVPQSRRGESWSEGPSLRAPDPGAPMSLTLAALIAVQKEFNIDAQRLYVLGLSMGGGGVWDLIANHPKLFAAAVPICGAGDPARAKLLTQMPIWCFHGDADPLVSVEYARAMIAAIRKAGGNPKYTEYPGVGHNSYDKAFLEPEFPDWLFAQKRGEVPSSATRRDPK